MSSHDPKYEAYHKEIKDLHDALKRAKRGNTPPRRDYTETPKERYDRKEKERQRRGNTSPKRGHTETPTERYHRIEKEKQKKKERQIELEREQHRARRLDKIQDMVKEREERERTHETAEAPNEEDPFLKKPQMANMYDLLTQLHQCA